VADGVLDPPGGRVDVGILLEQLAIGGLHGGNAKHRGGPKAGVDSGRDDHRDRIVGPGAGDETAGVD